VYVIKFTDDGLADVKNLPKHVKNSIKKEFEKKVMVDPIGCAEPLGGVLEGWHSFHYLEYRVIYKVIEDIKAISVVGIGRHDKDAEKDVYRRLENLARTGKLAESVLLTFREIAPHIVARK
jgi:mRNA-degrading endonuclease RelE of RelBE toxin-antitoxin system